MSRVYSNHNRINYDRLRMEQALQSQTQNPIIDKRIQLFFPNEEHIKVCTAVVNNPIFIEIQYFTLKKYMKVDFEFIVFNDAKDFPDFSNGFNANIKNEIIKTCETLNIKCINIPNNHHKIEKGASNRCADSCNYMLKYQLEYPGKYLILDCDMFLIDYFEKSKYDVAFVLQSRGQIEYIWPGICYFNTNKMNNKNLLNWNCSPGCDCGGEMQHWLKLQNKDNIYFIKHLSSCNWNEIPESFKDRKDLINFIQNDPRNENGKYFCEIYDNKFLHYRAATNWMYSSDPLKGMNLHQDLSQKLKKILTN